jgi:hypothetical protein
VEFGRITDATSFKYASHAPPTKTADAENDGSDTSTSTTDTEEGARPEGGGEPAGKSKHGTTAELDYGSIGGLKREIDAVREVVELAVNSPKLFTEYGTPPASRLPLLAPPASFLANECYPRSMQGSPRPRAFCCTARRERGKR